MIIKTNNFELSISADSEIYLGSKRTGQIFRKWAEMDENLKAGLEMVMEQFEDLMEFSEYLIQNSLGPEPSRDQVVPA